MQPLWAACSTAWLSSRRSRLSLHLTRLSLISIQPSTVHCYEKPPSIFLRTSCTHWRTAVRSPKKSFPGWTSSASSAAAGSTTPAAPGQLGVFLLNSLQWALTLYWRPLLNQYLHLFFFFKEEQKSSCQVIWNQEVITFTQQLSYARVLHQEFKFYNDISQHKLRQYSVISDGPPKKILLALLKNYYSSTAKPSIFSFKFTISKPLGLCILYILGHGASNSKLTPSLKKRCCTKSREFHKLLLCLIPSSYKRHWKMRI